MLFEKIGKERYNIYEYKCILYLNGEYDGKLWNKLKEKGITTYTIRQKALIPQSTLTKLKMCSDASMEEIE